MGLLNKRARNLVFAAGAASLAVVAFGPAQAAFASENGSIVTTVAFSGSSASPTVTLSGTGFGSAPTKSVAVSGLSNCPGGFSGTDWTKGKLWVVDASADAQWSAGAASSKTSGNCLGINVSSWSSTKIVFTFGDYYGTNASLTLHGGDAIAVSVKGDPGFGNVPSGF